MKQQITIKGQLNNVKNKEEIINLMRLFGNAKRYAFNQIIKNSVAEPQVIAINDKQILSGNEYAQADIKLESFAGFNIYQLINHPYFRLKE